MAKSESTKVSPNGSSGLLSNCPSRNDSIRRFGNLRIQEYRSSEVLSTSSMKRNKETKQSGKNERKNKLTGNNFFQAAVVSTLLYGYTTWTLTKYIGEKLHGNCTRIIWTILNKSGSNIPQNNSCRATYLPSLKPSK